VRSATLVERFRAALTANSAQAHGPFPVEAAFDTAVMLAVERAGGRPVAVATGDPVLAPFDLPSRLEAAGAEVLLPGDRETRGTGCPREIRGTGCPRETFLKALAGAGAGMTGGVFGLAATGTVGVACGPGAPRAVSLVPPAHLCLVRAGDLVEDLAEALGRLPSLPSGLAWVSGPSRSADLEMTLTLGVHGPASVDVIIIDAE
jgi:L-lactate dehydrogenase complex protein LldG